MLCNLCEQSEQSFDFELCVMQTLHILCGNDKELVLEN